MGTVLAIVVAVALFGLVSASSSSTIDFEGLTEGDTVSSVFAGSGVNGFDAGGTIEVTGFDPDLDGNTAMVFYAECLPGGTAAECTGGDVDLIFPGHGNILILTEDGQSGDPDDAEVRGSYFTFDFSAWGSGQVEVVSIDIGNVEENEATPLVELYSGGGLQASINLPITGNNVIETMLIGESGIDFMIVRIEGSGTIDNIVLAGEDMPEFARITDGGWRTTDPAGLDIRSSQGCHTALRHSAFQQHADQLAGRWLQQVAYR